MPGIMLLFCGRFAEEQIQVHVDRYFNGVCFCYGDNNHGTFAGLGLAYARSSQRIRTVQAEDDIVLERLGD